MGQQIGIELEDSKYYIVWVAPNPNWKEQKVKFIPELRSYMEAITICDQLNRETKGRQGKHEVRKEVA